MGVARRVGADHLAASTSARPGEVIGRYGHAGLAEVEVTKGWQEREGGAERTPYKKRGNDGAV